MENPRINDLLNLKEEVNRKREELAVLESKIHSLENEQITKN